MHLQMASERVVLAQALTALADAPGRGAALSMLAADLAVAAAGLAKDEGESFLRMPLAWPASCLPMARLLTRYLGPMMHSGNCSLAKGLRMPSSLSHSLSLSHPHTSSHAPPLTPRSQR